MQLVDAEEEAAQEGRRVSVGQTNVDPSRQGSGSYAVRKITYFSIGRYEMFAGDDTHEGTSGAAANAIFHVLQNVTVRGRLPEAGSTVQRALVRSIPRVKGAGNRAL